MSDSKPEQIFGYKALYQQVCNFLKALSEDDLQLTKSIPMNSLECLGLYSRIIKSLQKRHQLQTQNNQLLKDQAILKQRIVQLQKARNQQLGLQEGNRLKLQIFLRLQLNDIRRAQQLANKNHLFCFSQIIQQIEEYRWLVNTMEIRMGKKQSLEEGVEKKVEFSPKRKVFQDELYHYFNKSDQYNKILQQRLNQVLNKKFKEVECFSSQANALFKNISTQLWSLKRVTKQIVKKQQEVRSQFEQLQSIYISRDRYNQDCDRFFEVIEKYLRYVREKLDNQEINKIIKRILNDQKQKDQKPLDIPSTLSRLKSSQSKHLAKLTTKELKDLEEQISRMNSLLKNFKEYNETSSDNYYKDTIGKTTNLLQNIVYQKSIDKDTISLMAKIIASIGEKLRNFNERIRIRTGLSGMIQLQKQHQSFKMMEIFEVNVNLLIENFLKKTQQPEIQSQQISAQLPQESAQLPQESSYKLNLQKKSKTELIKLVCQLKQHLASNETIIKKQDQNQQEVQSKYVQQHKILQQSMILIPILEKHSAEQSKQPNLEMATEMANLKQQIEQKDNQISQLKSAINVRVEEEERKFKEKYQKEVQRYKIKLEKSKQDFEEVMESMNQLIDQKKYEFQCRESLQNSKNIKDEEIEQLRKKVQYLESEEYKLRCFNDLKQKHQLQNEKSYCQIGAGSRDVNSHDQETEALNMYLSSRRSLNIQKTESYTFQSKQSKMMNRTEGSSQPPQDLKNQEAADKSRLSQQNEQLKLKNEELSRKVEAQQKSLLAYKFDLQHQKEQLELKISLLERELQQLRAKMDQESFKSKLFKPSNLQTNHLFPIGFIFDENFMDERLYLINTLTTYVGPIRKAQLLYRFDPFNKANPHRYVDKHPHIVAVLKTIYGKYVAAYSRQPIDSAGTKVGFGLLMALWNRRTFEILPSKKPVTYDDYFIIFGNSELRLKSQQTKVFSNFGINNAYFNSGGAKIDAFLGEGSLRQLNFESYEIYTLNLQRSW